MPVKFTCPHCGQLMSVPEHQIGQPVQCLQCNKGVVVPPPISDARYSAPGLDESQDPASTAARPGTVEISRGALYSIGALLAATAVAAFALGWGLGQQSGPQVDLSNPASWQRLNGRVSYLTQRGRNAPDSEAVIIALPVGRRPDEKLKNESFRPDIAPSEVSKTMLQAIRTLGGGYDRANRDGIYEIELPLADEYYVLILSSHVSRPARSEPSTTQIVEIGKYFDRASDLVSRNDFVWQKQIVKGECSLDHQFGE